MNRSRPARPALLAGLLLAAGCGGAEAPAVPPVVLNLLARRPDAVIEEPGLLRPDGEREWGPYGLSGWTKDALAHPDPAVGLYVPANQPIAVLDLPAVGPAARTIEIEAWCSDPPGGAPATVQIRLNGLALGGEIVLGTSPARISLPTPAPAWHAGENLLEIEASTVPAGARPDGTPVAKWHTVCVSRVEYGPPLAVTLPAAAARVLRLPAATGVRYFVETAPGARVRVHGRASGPGTLHVQLGAMDPATGNVSEEGFPALDLAPREGVLAATFPTPARVPGVLQLEMVWSSPAGDELALDALAVEEDGGRPRPPIVFISIDTFAARHLAMHGYRRETTPNLERLRAEAVVFDHCVANAPWTLPSYLSVLTGLYPRAHATDVQSAEGLALNDIDYWQVADNRWTLAEMLRARGYRTAGFVDTLWLSEKFQVAQGFDLYDIDAASLPFQEPTYGIAFIAARLGPWLDGIDPAAPFFLFVHSLDAHGPYWPEFPFKGRFQGDRPAAPRTARAGGDYQTAGAIPDWMASTLTGPPSPAAPAIPREQSVDDIEARYDESLLKVDHYIGVILAMLAARGLYEDALVVITGDHGESFAHDFYGHGRLWEDIVHVPLLIKMPRGEHGGRRVTPSVELVDLYPTLVELAGVPAPREHLHGRSLLPLIRGEEAAPRPTFSEGGHHEGYMVELDGWKLVRTWPGRESGEPTLLSHHRVPREWLEANFPELVDAPLTHAWWKERRQASDYAPKVAELRKRIEGPYTELYYLPEDPNEEHDLAAARPDVVDRLLPLLEERRRRGQAARKAAAWDTFVPDFDPAALEALQGLGYAGGK
ncbi:MAG: sulfatase [Planctomycetota bacterium]